jgi:AraC-like DNA-binding protein
VPSPGRSKTLPTASGGISRAAYARARDVGIDVKTLLKRCGLTLEQIRDRNLRIPVRAQIRLLDAVAKATGDEFLGLSLAEVLEPRELGLLYYVSASSDTLIEALRRAARYSSIQNEGVRITCCERDYLGMTFEYVGVSRQSDRHQIEFMIAILLRVARLITGRRLMPAAVRLAHRRTALPPRMQAFFGTDLEFGSMADEIVFPRAAGDIPIVHADPHLNRLLVHFCEEALSRRRPRSKDWRVKVENAMVPLLPHGRADMAEVARRLGVSRRTLARRLAAEGLTFGDILGNLRRALAQRYLREPGLQVSEVAWLLGYREASAFSHAYRRWTGQAPRRDRPANSRAA